LRRERGVFDPQHVDSQETLLRLTEPRSKTKTLPTPAKSEHFARDNVFYFEIKMPI
jgi:hypothetical protein